MELVEKLLRGDVASAAKAITVVENDPKGAARIISAVFSHTGKAHVIGVTGPPGAGKSTLTSALIELYRGGGNTVGVIAVDSSSPFSGGALLGDRIRMQKHFKDDKGVFIRSMGTRGSLGGLSRATQGACYILEAMGMDVLIIETVGVGQAEVDIMHIAGTVLLVLAPGLGDEIQALKAGVMEIADIFVVNKADRQGAEETAGHIENALNSGAGRRRGWQPRIFKTVATRSEGVAQVLEGIEAHRKAHKEADPKSNKSFSTQLLLNLVKERLAQRILGSYQGERDLQDLLGRITRKEIDPFTASDLVLDEVLARCV